MTPVLVLTATEVEAVQLGRHLGLARVAAGPWPHYRSGALEVAAVGPRAARLDERTAGCARPGVVVSAGACGALAPGLALGALVVPEVVLGPADTRYATVPLPSSPRSGSLLTVGEIVATPEAKARLWLETGAMAVDMESAIVAEWAASRGLPVAVVRGVSDTAADTLPADLADVVEPDGRVRTARALRAVLARPRAIGDALALKRGTALALKAVAVALATLARA